MSAVAAHYSRMDGTAALAGMDPLDLPPRRFFNWVTEWFRERMTEQNFRSWEMQVNRPLPGQEPTEGVWAEDEMAKAFSQFTEEFDA